MSPEMQVEPPPVDGPLTGLEMPFGPKAEVKLANGLTKNASGRKTGLFIVAERR